MAGTRKIRVNPSTAISRTRQRLEKEWGAQQLEETEARLLAGGAVGGQAEAEILETKTRARLRRELGQKELARIEAQLIRGLN